MARLQLFLKFAPLVFSCLFFSSSIFAQTQSLFFTPPVYPLYVILPSSAITRVPYARWRNFSFAVLLALFAALTLFTPTVCAQTYIFGRADFAAGTEPSSVATGDFNGDGILDLVVTNSADDTISVLLGKADGTFEAQVTYPTGPRPNSVATGDFNGDGNLDLAVANENCILVAVGGMNQLQCSPSTVSIFLGNGDGTFRSKVDYSVGSGPSGVAVTDFNGDGNLDLAVVNYGDSTVSILLGNGDGTFQNQVVYSFGNPGITPQSQGSVVIGDFNNDHKLDLAVTGGGSLGTVTVLLGNGDGTFGKPINLPQGFGAAFSLAAGDFNHDGKLDLVVTGCCTTEVFLGNGDGTFTLNATYPGGTEVTVADFNGDGKLDLAISAAELSSAGPYAVSVLLGNGDGTFQPGRQYGTNLFPRALIASDFNGDGKLDLAVTDPGCSVFQCTAPGYVSVLLGFGDGTFVGKTDSGVGGPPLSITSADFNNDGKLDVATANQTVDSVSVLLGNGDGTFQPQASFPTGHMPVSVAASDFRNDGKTDLAVANETCFNPPCGPGSVSVLLGNGDGTFQPHVDYSTGVQPLYLAVGDFRGNGKVDIAVSNYAFGSGNTVSILLGNGDGTFQPHVDYLTAQSRGAITTGDFNGDGKLDLAVNGVIPGTGAVVSILLGNGDGTFRPHVDYPGGGLSIAAGDFNGDGRLDLVTGDSGSLSVLLGNGDGSFQLPVTYPWSQQGAPALAIGDFNGDGKLDLAAGAGSEASIWFGNGDGTFQPPANYLLANESLSSLIVADVNGDGVPDWAASDANTATIGAMVSAAFKAASPTALNFGSQGVGTTGRVQAITISNPSNVPFNIVSITAGGNFSETNDCGSSLKPGANCTVSVTFSPTAAGLEQGAITITDSTRSSPEAIPLTGTGVNGPFLTPFPGRVNFSPQIVGTKSAPAVIMLVNTGNASLGLTGITVTGTDSSDFSQSNNCGASLPVGGSCNVNVTFAPTAGGTRTAQVAVSDTAPGSPQTINLVGAGLAPDFQIAVSPLSPPTIKAGDSGTSTVTVTSVEGFNSAVAFSCAGLPSGANCSFNPASLPNGSGDSTLTVRTSATTAAGTYPISVIGTSGSLKHSASVSLVVQAPPGFTISGTAPSPASVSPGGSATSTITVAATDGFNQSVTLSCSSITLNGSPATTVPPACSFNPASVANGSGTSTLKVSTTASSALLNAPAMHRSGLFYALWLPICGLALIGAGFSPGSSKKKLLGGLLVCLMLSGLLFLAACGGGGSQGGDGGGGSTPAGTYTITVKGTGSSTMSTTTLTLVVQ
jgi:hypothetical protein